MGELVDEGLSHTEDAGDKAVERMHNLLEQLSTSVNNLTDNVGTLATHVATLQVQKSVEDVPHTARVAVNDGMDTTGAASGLVAKGVDVPLAVSEDVIHDGATTVGDGKEAVTQTRKKLFKRKRK